MLRARMRTVAALTVLLQLACATVHVRPAPPTLEPIGDRVDWAAVGAETAQLLSGYLRVDTVNPPGNELAGAEYLAAALAKDGISSELQPIAPGRANLIARLPASGPPVDRPLCLLSHLDVVSAEADQWPAGTQPLSGALTSDGYVWGRGALDMKGMGAVELMAFVLLKRLEVPLQRDVLLLAVADEEVDNVGMRRLVDERWGQLDCGVLVNEGGLGLTSMLFEGQTVFPIAVGEKGSLWLKVWARGEAGHGSTPVEGRAPAELVKAIEAIQGIPARPVIPDAVYELLRRVGAHKGGVTGAILQGRALVDLFVKPKLLDKPPSRAVLSDTCQLTGFEGKGSSPNVVPSAAAAIFDCRLLPSTRPETLLARLHERLRGLPQIHVEILQAMPGNESSWDDPFFDALVRNVTRGRPDAVAGPVLSPGFTDSIFARPKGTKAYGLVPFEVQGEELGTMHGKNERVSVANLRRGVEVLFRAVVETAGRP